MYHIPALLEETLALLQVKPDGIYVDCTGGGGGHSMEILKRIGKDGRLLILDKDIEAIKTLSSKFDDEGDRVLVRHIDFCDFDLILKEMDIHHVNGFLLDLGVSSWQINSPERGFSFSKSGLLDMRMDRSQSLSAANLAMQMSERDLTAMIRDYGEERHARKIARAIVRKRTASGINTSQDLKEIITNVIPPNFQIKTLARVFQAFRIAVNDELGQLKRFLEKSVDYLSSSGRIVVISYHSLEDRMVKVFFREQASDCVCPPDVPVCICAKQSNLRILTRRVVAPTTEEVSANSRSRSAKLRAAEYLG